jgi:DNA replication protein DnaC
MQKIGGVIHDPRDEHWKTTLLEKLRLRAAPMTAEEKRAWIDGEAERDAQAYAKYLADHPVDVRTVAANIGLHPDELSLDWSAINPGINDAHKAAKIIREAVTRGYGLIFLWGSWGQAKTLLGKILVARAHANHRRAMYSNFRDAMDDIMRAFDAQDAKTTALLDKIDWWTNRDVLVLDEFDKCNDTPWIQERKFQIVDRCYQRAIREEALTMIASNRGDDDVDGYIRSRLQDRRVGPVIYLNGQDGRRLMPDGWRH